MPSFTNEDLTKYNQEPENYVVIQDAPDLPVELRPYIGRKLSPEQIDMLVRRDVNAKSPTSESSMVANQMQGFDAMRYPLPILLQSAVAKGLLPPHIAAGMLKSSMKEQKVPETVDKVDPSKFEPKSIQEFKRTGNYGSLKPNVVAPKIKLLPAEEAKSFGVFDTLIGTLEGLRGNAENDKKYVGPFASKGWEYGQSLGMTDEPGFKNLQQDIQSLIETAYALSGKQISAQEIEQLKKIMPKISDPFESYKAAIDKAIKWLERKRKINLEAFKESGYDVTGWMGGSPNPDAVNNRLSQLAAENPGISDEDLYRMLAEEGF